VGGGGSGGGRRMDCGVSPNLTQAPKLECWSGHIILFYIFIWSCSAFFVLDSFLFPCVYLLRNFCSELYSSSMCLILNYFLSPCVYLLHNFRSELYSSSTVVVCVYKLVIWWETLERLT
jgi:hypothetical protein